MRRRICLRLFIADVEQTGRVDRVQWKDHVVLEVCLAVRQLGTSSDVVESTQSESNKLDETENSALTI